MAELLRLPVHWDRLDVGVASTIQDFVDELLLPFGERCGSLAVVGSAATPDYLPRRSDINTVLFLDEVHLGDLDRIAPLGLKYGPRLITAPLCFTVPYVQMSLDSFPIEFLNLQIEHATIAGRDLLSEYTIDPMFLRLGCERELKGTVLQLQQYWIRAAGKLDELPEILLEAFSAVTPVLRALLVLGKVEVPRMRQRLVSAVGSAYGCDVTPFQRVLDQRTSGRQIHPTEYRTVFERFLGTAARLSHIVDKMNV